MRITIIATALLAAIACTPSPTDSGRASGSPAALGTSSATASAQPTASGAASASASASAAATASGAISSPAATASAGASPGAGAAAGTDACSVASTADVEAVIGPLTTSPAKVELPLVGFTLNACVFASNEGTLTAAVGPRGTISKDQFDVAMRSVPDLAGAVSGVGDSAYSIGLDAPSGMAGAAGIVATKSGTYFTVQAAHKTKSSSALMGAVTDLAKKTAGLF